MPLTNHSHARRSINLAINRCEVVAERTQLRLYHLSYCAKRRGEADSSRNRRVRSAHSQQPSLVASARVASAALTTGAGRTKHGRTAPSRACSLLVVHSAIRESFRRMYVRHPHRPSHRRTPTSSAFSPLDASSVLRQNSAPHSSLLYATQTAQFRLFSAAPIHARAARKA